MSRPTEHRARRPPGIPPGVVVSRQRVAFPRARRGMTRVRGMAGAHSGRRMERRPMWRQSRGVTAAVKRGPHHSKTPPVRSVSQASPPATTIHCFPSVVSTSIPVGSPDSTADRRRMVLPAAGPSPDPRPTCHRHRAPVNPSAALSARQLARQPTNGQQENSAGLDSGQPFYFDIIHLHVGLEMILGYLIVFASRSPIDDS